MENNNVVDFHSEVVKRNVQEILAELHRKHEETGECGIYEITNSGKLGEKISEL